MKGELLQGRRSACIVLDSAQQLREAPWAPQLLNALEQFSRQGVHVVLAACDCTFPAWATQRECELSSLARML